MLHKISILMSTYNGELYLKDQLESIKNQTIKDYSLLVRDDGSTDMTQYILDKYQSNGYLKWYKGNNLGAAQSFLDLLSNSTSAEYYAFADQDDYWCEEKLEKAIQKLEKYREIPCLYCSNLTITDENLISESIQYDNSKYYRGLESACLYNLATGCTMVFNDKLCALLKRYSPRDIEYHDWWVYIVALAFGKVIFDENSYIKYRQHEFNVIGFIPPKRNFIWGIKKIIGYGQPIRWNKGRKYLQELYKGYSLLLNESQINLIYNLIYFKENRIARINLCIKSNLSRCGIWKSLFIKFFILLGKD